MSPGSSKSIVVASSGHIHPFCACFCLLWVDGWGGGRLHCDRCVLILVFEWKHISVVDPEGVRSNPLPAPVFQYPMKMK